MHNRAKLNRQVRANGLDWDDQRAKISASPVPISRWSVWRCAFLRAVMMFLTTSYCRGFLARFLMC